MLMEQSLEVLFGILAALIFASAFFSGSETAMMSVDRYRLRHRSKTSKSARRVLRLLDRPDRLLGVILIGNTFANILASAVATIIALRLLDEQGVFLASLILTILLLIFGEITPKTFAAIKSDSASKFAAPMLSFLLKILYPFVLFANVISNGILKLFRINVRKLDEGLSGDELRTVVFEASNRLGRQRRSMLLGVLDLEQASIDDIMIPRSEVVAIDLDSDWDVILDQLANCQHTFLPVYRRDINNVLGILHVRDALNMMASDHFNKTNLIKTLREACYTPAGSALGHQLVRFRSRKERLALVVNEYGDVQGLVTLEDILEEIVGEFTTDYADASKDVHPQEDGSFIVDGTAYIRDLNRTQHWDLPMESAKTVSGLIINYLGDIPNAGICVMINQRPIEVLQVKDNIVRSVRISPKWRKNEHKDNRLGT